LIASFSSWGVSVFYVRDPSPHGSSLWDEDVVRDDFLSLFWRRRDTRGLCLREEVTW